MLNRILIGSESGGAEVLKNLLGATFDLAFAKDALELVNLAHVRRPDLIMCDLIFDESSVFRLLRAIREDPQLKEIPLVCACILPSRMPQSLVATFELLFKQLGGCTYIDVLALESQGQLGQFVPTIQGLIALPNLGGRRASNSTLSSS